MRVFRFSDIVYNEQALAVSCEYLGDDRSPTLVTCQLALPAYLPAWLPACLSSSRAPAERATKG